VLPALLRPAAALGGAGAGLVVGGLRAAAVRRRANADGRIDARNAPVLIAFHDVIGNDERRGAAGISRAVR